jgi:hypothetical protein
MDGSDDIFLLDISPDDHDVDVDGNERRMQHLVEQ